MIILFLSFIFSFFPSFGEVGGANNFLQTSLFSFASSDNTQELLHDFQGVHEIIFSEDYKDIGFDELRTKEKTFQGFVALHETWKKDFDLLVLKKNDGMWIRNWDLNQLQKIEIENQKGKEAKYRQKDLTFHNFQSDEELKKDYEKIFQNPQGGLAREGILFLKNTEKIEKIPGTMYQSGIHYHTYEQMLKESVSLVESINSELDAMRRKLCIVCISKQAVSQQTCPRSCFQ